MIVRRKNFSLFGLFGNKKEWSSEEKHKYLEKFIERGLGKKNSLSSAKLISDSHSLEKDLDIKFKKDWYKFIDLIVRFYNKNIPTWYNILKSADLTNVDYTYSKSSLILCDEFDELFPYPYICENDENDIQIIGIGNDDCISFIPKEEEYEIWYETRFKKLSDALKDYNIKENLDITKNNYYFYKENPDIYKTHLKIVEEYQRLIKTV
jgi:hypothetical protein